MTRRSASLLASVLAITACSAAIAYFRAFSSMRPYDDEGLLMMAVKRFFDGQPLYDSVRSIYGPFYYFYEWLPHAITGAGIGHDVVRWISTAWWTAAGLLLLWIVWRATGSMLLAAAAHFVAFRTLGFIGFETGHPQEACIFLLLAVVLAAACIGRTSVLWFVMSALAGVIALTKINLAIFVLAAMGVLFAMSLPPGMMRRVLVPATACGALALSPLLMAPYLGQGWGARYSALVVLSLAAAIVAAGAGKIEPRVGIVDAVFAALGFGAGLLVIAAFPLLQGSTVAGMYQGLVVAPRTNFITNLTTPLQVRPLVLVWAAVSLALACLYRQGRMSESWLAVLKLAFVVAATWFSMTYAYHELAGLATPLFWLAAAPCGGQTSRGPLRPLLAILGVLQVLYAFPVAGSQARFVTVLLPVVAAICVRDTLPWLAACLPRIDARGVAVACAIWLAVLYAHDLYSARSKYATLEPLNLPGAHLLRVEPERATALRRLTAAAKSCSVLVTEPGMFSLNLLSGVPPLPSLDFEAWMLFLNREDQRAIAGDLAREPRACVIVNEEMVRFWAPHRDVSGQPLVRAIRENFRPAFETEGYEFMVRR
jgi:hypothetical protein